MFVFTACAWVHFMGACSLHPSCAALLHWTCLNSYHSTLDMSEYTSWVVIGTQHTPIYLQIYFLCYNSTKENDPSTHEITYSIIVDFMKISEKLEYWSYPLIRRLWQEAFCLYNRIWTILISLLPFWNPCYPELFQDDNRWDTQRTRLLSPVPGLHSNLF